MYFKDNTYIALLLFIVIILFSFFSEYRSKQNMLYIEGLNNEQEDEDIMEDVNNIEEDTNLVPSCYSSLMDDKNLYNNQNNDKYMLKSQMVPPVCPACPTNINNHNHDNSNNNMNDNSLNIVDLCNNDLSETQNINVTNEIIDISNSLNENIYNNVNDLQTTNYMSQMKNLKNEMVRIQQEFSDNNSMNPNNNYMNSNNNSMNQNNNSMNSNNCPPCPPCDRCPEPIFSCEKTINYRSPNVGQYLPLPVLNDFSNFTNT